jgi:hypothetical protein
MRAPPRGDHDKVATGFELISPNESPPPRRPALSRNRDQLPTALK